MRPTGLHHVGVPVRSIERSIAWYGEIFGLEPSFVATAEGPELSQTVQLPDVKLRFAFLEVGNTVIEFLEYESPVGEDYAIRNCDVGALHICLEFEDLQATYAELRAKGVEFNIPPTRVLGGVLDGDWNCYLQDPDGIPIELWQRGGSVS
jgi:catechol 2,3-dioxygenase-like lactoylglutathione lyase family enzyme